MSDAPTSATSAATDGHGLGDVHADGHEPPEEPLGPVDVRAWASAILGGAIGVLVALALFAAGS